MRALVCTLIAACLLTRFAAACPESVVALDPNDPSLASGVWAPAGAAWRKGDYAGALKKLRAVGARLERDVGRLFRPGRNGKAPSNAAIQRFLAATVYARPPALQVEGDRFLFPAAVLWAWADAACRQNAPEEALTALHKLQVFRDDGAVRRHLLAVALRAGRAAEAKALVRELPPEGFFTPYAEAEIARLEHDLPLAQQRLAAAEKAAITPAQRALVEALAQRLGSPPS